MEKHIFFTSLLAAFLGFYYCPERSMDFSQNLDNTSSELALNQEKYSFSVLQFNIWQEGTQVSGGYDAIVNEIAAREPDFVTLSEVRNYNNTSFDERIVASLKAKGKTYYASKGDDNGVLSKYPVKDYSSFSNGTYHRLIAEIRPGQEIAVYSGHLDYTHYAVYYPRGYDPVTSKPLSAPVTDLGKIAQMNSQSQRPQQIKDFIERSKEDIQKGRIVILGGDFNEASHLDWTEAVKNKYDHNGVVMPWSSTLSLDKAGFKDSYRVMYPNEADYPGFTWVAQKPWAPKADERDRIDYIFYYDNGKIKVDDSYIVGPKETIVKNISTPETSKDKFSLPTGIWPSDHKAVWSTFTVRSK
ncbi:endonuclease/exonuclease/phosphatase family protein [Chryseobacterium angstadtii]|nr:endonuclease/exonuclease/phosphatase family protein [Chryseobacterium angstadtii]